jgi:arylsulfatase A
VAGGKGTTTDAGTHVPLIGNWPGKVPAGRVSRDLVDSTDFLPTMLEATGVERPRDLALDGQSFFPQLLGKTGKPRAWTYCWYSQAGGPTGVEFARTQRFKLYGDGRFYDVSADPLEQAPLTAEGAEGEARQARKQLQEALDRFKGTRVLSQ